MILYVVSDRGAFSHGPGRKIISICDTWRELGYPVELVSGGDVDLATAPADGSPNPRPGNRLTSTPDLDGILAPLVHSVSEFRDMRHDRRLEAHILGRLGTRRPKLVWHRASRLHCAPLRVAQKLGVPYVLEWIDRLVSYDLSLFRRWAARADRRRMREAHRIVVTSAHWKREVAEEFGLPDERIIVSHNAVDPGEFTRDPQAGSAVRKQMGIPEDALVVGFVGSYGWYHEAHLVADAAARLRGRTRVPVYFLMVGDGPNRARLDERARELEVEDVVLREGAVPHADVPRWLSAMDAAVVPANGGEIICPMKVQEYMAASTAPIVADSAANREVVDEDRTGLFFRSSDPDSMADAIARLASMPGRAAELGRAARNEVIERFTWRETVGRALEQILPPPGRGASAAAGAARSEPQASGVHSD